jgi:hypothetical protein
LKINQLHILVRLYGPGRCKHGASSELFA